MIRSHHLPRVLAACVLSVAVMACVDDTPVAPPTDVEPAFTMNGNAALNRALAELRRATARYHDIAAAEADGFILVHGCEVRDDEGPAGAVYADLSRFDAILDPALPEGLLYEPTKNGRMRLVGVELAIPYAAWPHAEPPEFFGAQFQPEDEFGVWGLHVWVWRQNPNGMFAKTNPHVTCDVAG